MDSLIRIVILLLSYALVASALSAYERNRLEGTWTGQLQFRVLRNAGDPDETRWMCDTANTWSVNMWLTFDGDEFTYYHEEWTSYSSGFHMFFPSVSTSGMVTAYQNDELTLKPHNAAETTCRRLYQPDAGDSNRMEWTVQANMQYARSDGCDDGSMVAFCSTNSKRVILTAVLTRSTTIVHQVPKGSCSLPVGGWKAIAPVDCSARDPEPMEWWWYAVWAAPVVAGLCCLCGAWFLCRALADNPSPWTCLCRLACLYLCRYGVNARVHPKWDDDEDYEEKPVFRAKKYRRATTMELAGELSPEEMAARQQQQQDAAKRQRKRRNTVSHIDASTTVQGFTADDFRTQIPRAPDPTQQFVGNQGTKKSMLKPIEMKGSAYTSVHREAPEPSRPPWQSMQSAGEQQRKQRQRRKSVAW